MSTFQELFSVVWFVSLVIVKKKPLPSTGGGLWNKTFLVIELYLRQFCPCCIYHFFLFESETYVCTHLTWSQSFQNNYVIVFLWASLFDSSNVPTREHFRSQKRYFRADLHGTIFVACDNGLRQANDMIYDCCVRQKECRSILRHILKRGDNRKSSRRPVVRLSHATKIVPCK